MKKLLSIILSAIMAVSMLTVAAIPAFAADGVQSPTAATLIDGKVTPTVNGENRQGVTYSPSTTNSNEITFRYNGDGTLLGWEENLIALGLVQGVDYNRVDNADGSMTITFISQKAIGAWNAGTVKVNALVDFGEEEETTEDEETTEEEDTTKKNASPKSPKTGASTAVVAGSIAAAGAGLAVLAATKKRDAE